MQEQIRLNTPADPATDLDKHRVAALWLRDDFQRLRGQTQRALCVEIEVLGDAIAAVRKGKVGVAESLLARAVNRLRELEGAVAASSPSA